MAVFVLNNICRTSVAFTSHLPFTVVPNHHNNNNNHYHHDHHSTICCHATNENTKDNRNFIHVKIDRPLGIDLEEVQIDSPLGVYIASISKDSNAYKSGKLERGLKLIIANDMNVENEI